MTMMPKFLRNLRSEGEAVGAAAPERAPSVARRHFLCGGKPLPLRPPWALSEDRFLEGCSRCRACMDHCPEQLLEADNLGYPQVNYQRGECTFCGICVDHCPEEVLRRGPDSLPWERKASIGAACVAGLGTVCRACGEQCEPGAIRFRPRSGGVVAPTVDPALCNGCGACFRVCPARAVSIG
ncbi:MAG: ferredoxin-type protein NapF [Desulfobulbaceae bacterium]|nr:ferredoxin-type protein NapF [Desulfobulbaceae bacterium]